MSSTYQARKAKGVCTRCGGKRDDARYSMCSNCLAQERNRYKRLLQRLPAKDLLEYKTKRAAYANARMKRLRSEGKCIRCMGPSPDKWICDACRQRMKEQEGLVRRE